VLARRQDPCRSAPAESSAIADSNGLTLEHFACFDTSEITAKNRVCYTGPSRQRSPLQEKPARKSFTVPKLRISIVEYLNTAPLIRGFTHGPLQGKYELSFTVPSQCAEALRTGAADVAIIPAIEYQRIVSQGIDLAILPDLAIASKERVRSLLLLSKKPIEQARSIALDRSSRSTQALTRILCARLWHAPGKGVSRDESGKGAARDESGQVPEMPEMFEAEPRLIAMLAQADAALLIGDPALRLALELQPALVDGKTFGDLGFDRLAEAGKLVEAGKPSQASRPSAAGKLYVRTSGVKLYVYDVVEEWRRMTGLPAVLAVWAGRREAITPEVVADFLASREYGVSHLPQICAEAARHMQLPEKELRAYLEKNIDYSLDEENLQGLLAFFQHSAALGLIDRLEPIRIADRPAPVARQSA
jgi:chorismate dehydratase